MLGMHVVNECLLVPLGATPDEGSIKQLQAEVLTQTQTASFKGVLFDVSTVQLLDSACFDLLVQVARSVSFMGFKSVFVGFQAGVAGALIDLNVDTGGINTAIDMEDAFAMLQEPDPTLAEGGDKEIDAFLDVTDEANQ